MPEDKLKTFNCPLLKVEIIKDERGRLIKRIHIDPVKFIREKRIPCSKKCKKCLGTVNVNELLEKGWKEEERGEGGVS